MTGRGFNVKDDFEAVEKATYVCDALYTYSKLELLRKEYRDKLERMNRKQKYEFLQKKMQEETKAKHLHFPFFY